MRKELHTSIQKPFSQLEIGQAFYSVAHNEIFIKMGLHTAESVRMTAVTKTMDDIESDTQVLVWAKKKVFDGQRTVEVDACCSGSVIRRDTMEAQAFRNMVDAPKLKKAVLVCKDCGRHLHDIACPP